MKKKKKKKKHEDTSIEYESERSGGNRRGEMSHQTVQKRAEVGRGPRLTPITLRLG